jgi:hypothetical protein
MPRSMSAPKVVRSYCDEAFDALTPVWCLRWGSEEADAPERLWELPEGVSVFGPPPAQFGVSVRRSRGAYAVRVLWDRTVFSWAALSRMQLLGSALAPLLAALGKDLWHLLEQPPGASGFAPRRAA